MGAGSRPTAPCPSGRTDGPQRPDRPGFDALGNWTTATTNGIAQSRTANARNEVTQVGGSTLAYSATGNLATDEQGHRLVYDAWNRLVSTR
jgi:hypothetical protein